MAYELSSTMVHTLFNGRLIDIRWTSQLMFKIGCFEIQEDVLLKISADKKN